MAQWPHRRRPPRRHSYLLPALLIGTVIAIAAAWSFRSQLLVDVSSSVVEEEDRPWLTPALYGVASRTNANGAVLVDTHDSTGPIALVVGTPGTSVEDWAALQALLERQGMGSVVLVPSTGQWAPAVRRMADSGLARAERQQRPVVVVAFGRALDSLLVGVPVGHGIRTSRLVSIAPDRAHPTGWRGLLAKFVRRGGAKDERLAAWSGAAFVLHARDDADERVAVARALAVGTGRDAGVYPGGGIDQAPKHPRDEDWREIVEFLAGERQTRDAVVGTDSVAEVTDTSVAVPTTQRPPATTVGRP